MSEFIAGLFCGAIVMFFAGGWLWVRSAGQIEPIDDYDLIANSGDAVSPAPNE